MLQGSWAGCEIGPYEMQPESELDCINEIDGVITLIAGLRNMFNDLMEGKHMPMCEETAMVNEAYNCIINREISWGMSRLMVASKILHEDVQRRGRIRKAARRRKARQQKTQHDQ